MNNVSLSVSSLRVVALVRGAETAQSLREGIGGDHDLLLSSPQPSGREIPPAELVIAEVDLDAAEDIVWLERLVRQLAGRSAVAVTCPRTSVEGMRRVMRMGIVDVLPQPIDQVDLRAICRSVAQCPPSVKVLPAGTDGKTVCVLKSCGGAGATTIATQIACAAAKDREGRVLLVDLDVQFGSAALYLDLPQKTSVVDLLGSVDRLDGPMLRSAAAVHSCGVHLLPAPAHLTPLDAIEPAAVQRLLAAARGEYSMVMVELPQAWTRWSRGVLEACDTIFMVMTLSVPSVRHARRQLDTLADEGLDHIPLTIIGNRVREGLWSKPSAIAKREAEQALGKPISATLPYDDLLFRTATLGQPVGLLPDGKALAKRFAGLVAVIPLVEDKR